MVLAATVTHYFRSLRQSQATNSTSPQEVPALTNEPSPSPEVDSEPMTSPFLQDSVSIPFVPKLDYPPATIDPPLSESIEELWFQDYPFYVGMLEVYDSGNDEISNEFGIYFDENLSVLTEEQEILVDQFDSGFVDRVLIPGKSHALMNEMQMDFENAEFRKDGDGITVESDSIAIRPNK
jgi:hypothetical protein